MSKPTPPATFKPLLQPASARQPSRFFGPASAHNILRDQLPLPTWLALGSLIQGALYLLLGARLAFLPALVYLLVRALDAYAQTTGWKSNPHMAGVLKQKFSAQFPDPEAGDFGSQPASQGVVVLLIGTRCNHPLGLLAPGFKQTGEYFQSMARSLDAHSEEFGFLGMSSYLNLNDRTSGNELLSVAYFRTTAGLHAFAHSEYHREGWNWWNRTVKEHSHISIFHEVFEAPRGHWENIYVNSAVSGICATQVAVPGKEGQGEWVRPVVDASRGLLKTSKERMGRSGGEEHEGYAFHDVYE